MKNQKQTNQNPQKTSANEPIIELKDRIDKISVSRRALVIMLVFLVIWVAGLWGQRIYSVLKIDNGAD
jgi:hypothetical protein